MKNTIINLISILVIILLEIVSKLIIRGNNCIYFKNGEIVAQGRCKGNSKEGIWILRDDANGNIIKVNSYKNNKRNGKCIDFYDDSLCVIRMITYFINDTAEGIIKFFDENGKVIIKYKVRKNNIILEKHYKNDSLIYWIHPLNPRTVGSWDFHYFPDHDFSIRINRFTKVKEIIQCSIIFFLLVFNLFIFINQKFKK